MDFYGLNIGDTPLIEVPELSARYYARVLVKDEGYNHTGSMKDRRNAHVLMEDSGKEHPVYYVGITSGNSGNSMNRLARRFEEQTGKERGVVNIVPREISRETRRELARYGPVVEMDLSRDILPVADIMMIARKHVPSNAEIRTLERMDGYRGLVDELYNEDFTHLFTPLGSGELLYNMYRGFLGRKGVSLIGATVDGNVNASEKRFLGRTRRSTADKLPCAYSSWQGLVDRVWLDDGNMKYVLTNEEIEEEIEFLNEPGHGICLDVGPNAAAAFAAARKHAENGYLRDDDVALIIKTDAWKNHLEGLVRRGRGRYAWRAIGALSACLALAGYAYTSLNGRKADMEAKEQLVEALKSDDLRKYAIFGLAVGEDFSDALNHYGTAMWPYHDNVARQIVRDDSRLSERWDEWNEWAEENLSEEDRYSEANMIILDGIVSRMDPRDIGRFRFAYDRAGGLGTKESNNTFNDIFITLECYYEYGNIDRQAVEASPDKMAMVREYEEWLEDKQ